MQTRTTRGLKQVVLTFLAILVLISIQRASQADPRPPANPVRTQARSSNYTAQEFLAAYETTSLLKANKVSYSNDGGPASKEEVLRYLKEVLDEISPNGLLPLVKAPDYSFQEELLVANVKVKLENLLKTKHEDFAKTFGPQTLSYKKLYLDVPTGILTLTQYRPEGELIVEFSLKLDGAFKFVLIIKDRGGYGDGRPFVNFRRNLYWNFTPIEFGMQRRRGVNPLLGIGGEITAPFSILNDQAGKAAETILLALNTIP